MKPSGAGRSLSGRGEPANAGHRGRHARPRLAVAGHTVENRHVSKASGFSTDSYTPLSGLLDGTASLSYVTSASRPLLRCAAAHAIPLASAAAVAGASV